MLRVRCSAFFVTHYNDPVDYVDPSGNMPSPYLVLEGQEIEEELQIQYSATHSGSCGFGDPQMFRGQGWIGTGWILPYLKPDIFNATNHTYMEIKPLSKVGIAKGETQIMAYGLAFGGPWVPAANRFYPDMSWMFPGEFINTPTFGQYYVINVGGIIYYTDVRAQIARLAVTAVAVLADPAELRAIGRLSVETLEEALGRAGTLARGGILAEETEGVDTTINATLITVLI